MYKKFKKRTNAQVPLNTIDENATIKLPRLSSAQKTDDAPGDLTNESEEENIPASQEQTQRFLSQHSIVLAATLGRTQSSSRINCSRQPNSFFEMVLLNAGVQLDQPDTFVLSCDHIAIVSKLRNILVNSSKYPENIETFKNGLSAALSPKSKLAQKLLSGCTIDTAGEEQVYQSQNSMFINFLMIDFLREPCISVLFNKIEEIAKLDRVQTVPGCVPLLPLMLAQLRYLTLSHSDQIYAHIERIFNNATESSKMDIISSVEFLLDASKHDDFVDLLTINYASSKDLFHLTTLQMLSNLTLSERTQGKLRERVLEFIKEDSSNSHTILPHIIRLLLNSLNHDTDEIVRQLVVTLREIFNWRYESPDEPSATASISDKHSQLELFGFLQQGLKRSKRFYQIWQRTISGLPAGEFRSFDFIMLLQLIHINEDSTLFIENLVRRRIKLEHITVSILDEIKAHFPHILEQHINTLMHLLHDFMREKNPIVSDFAKASYSILFKVCNSIQKSILKKLLELTFDKSAQHVTTTLTLLRELQRLNAKHVQNCAMLFLPLLHRLGDLTLPQTRLAMDLLCHAAFPDPGLPECTQLQEQIEMVVKKQQINRNEYFKRQGIIGCVQLIDAIARIETVLLNSEDLQTSVDSITSLPDGRGKQAANLIMLTQSAVCNSPELLALFYDELASVFTVRYYNAESTTYMLDNQFIMWLCELMTYRFQQSFVNDQEPKTIKGIWLESLKNINELDETNVNTESAVLDIGINISELVLSPNANACDSILVLAPLFHLVSVLHNQRYQHSLEMVNALQGCAIVLPSFFDDPNYVAIFDNFDDDIQKSILSIYFHTINWMRVTTCAFASQKEKATRQRVLKRLADLITTEQKLKPLLAHAPIGFTPPPCQFLSNTKQPGSLQVMRERKPATSKGKANRAKNDTVLEEQSTEQLNMGELTIKLGACKTAKCKANFENLYGPMERFRPLDVGILVLLKEEPFSLNYPLEADEVGTHLGLLELRFILTDLVHKLDTIVNEHHEANEADSLRSHVVKPEHFISDLQKCLEKINQLLVTLAAHIDEELEKVNNVHSNLDLFRDRFNYVKTCFGLCIHLFALYFSWNGWDDKSKTELLESSLKALLPSSQSKIPKKPSLPRHASQLFEYFCKYEKSVLVLGTGVQLQQLLRSLRKLSCCGDNTLQRSKQQADEIRKICSNMLRRKWYHYSGSVDKGAQCNIHLDELVKGFLKDASIERQKDILDALKEECLLLNKKDSALLSIPNIKKPNFPLLFRGLCESLIITLSSQCTSHLEGDRFKLWESTIGLLNGLLEVVKKVEQPRNFALFLKHSQLFLKMLLQHGLPVLETIVRDSPERLTKFLDDLQNVTKFLHNLCCHSKTIKNTAIISYIPSLRETLETLVFRMKALLAANKCHAAFHISILDNKDLHGDAIRTPRGSLVNDTHSDEEIPEDDASVDETVMADDSISVTVDSSRRDSSNSRSKSSSRSKCF